MPPWLSKALAFLGSLIGIVPKVIPAPSAPVPEPTEPKAPAWGSIDEREDAEAKRRKGPIA